MDTRASLYSDFYLIGVKPTLMFLQRIWLITFRPASYASQVVLGDRTNFVRHARFFIEATALTFVLTSISASVGEQWIIQSEIRAWAFACFTTIVFAIAVYLNGLLIIRPRATLRDVLHVYFPIAAGVMIVAAGFRMLYRSCVLLIDAIFGSRLSEFVPPEPFQSEMWACLGETSIALRIFFGNGAVVATGKPFVQNFVELGGGAYLLAVTSTAVIASRSFSISKLRAAILAVASIILAFAAVAAVFFVVVMAIALQSNCATVAYERMGRKNPAVLLEYLARTQRAMLPDDVRPGVIEVGVSYDASGLIYEYRDTNEYSKLPVAEVEAIALAVRRNVFCDLAMAPEHYFKVLRDLGLGIIDHYALSKRGTQIVASVRAGDCRMNFAYGPLRYLAWSMRDDANPEVTGSTGR